MQNEAKADIVIFGGGIAGLWLLTRLRQTGLSAVLFESNTLGGGQTNKSQGIIHGGMKYALQGSLTKDAYAMSAMPTVWQRCLMGEGEIDLSEVPVLSRQHYLWAPNKLTSKLGGFFAGAALSTKVHSLKKSNFPAVFQQPEFKGDVFAMNELVIDVPALVKVLTKLNHDVIFKIDSLKEKSINITKDGKIESITISQGEKTAKLTAQHFIFAAGAGNEVMEKKLKCSSIAMQRRPLHMVLAKLPFDYDLYGHCLGMGPRPRITITTHRTQSGETVWYLGGQLAEDGVKRDGQTQIQAARKELKSLFPWLDFSKAEFASFMIDRAEPKQKRGLKPETAFSKTIANVTIVWPTKLALAPRLAEDIVNQFKAAKMESIYFDIHGLVDWPVPPFAVPVWEELFCKNIA